MSRSAPHSPVPHSTNAFSVRISPVSAVSADFRLPGDKSISHRSAILAAIGEGQSRIDNYSSARDCRNTLDCLSALGVHYEIRDSIILIDGVGLTGLRAPTSQLDAGNSGSTIRMLAGILAGQPFESEIGGDESLSRRPMRRIIEPLASMGAHIEARDSNFPPLRIRGGNLQAITYQPPVASAQVKTCVLFAGLFADGATTVIETTPTRDHSEIMLAECGADIRTTMSGESSQISITGGKSLRALGDYAVAGDVSSAAFFLVAALTAPKGSIRLRHIGINPSRTALIDVLNRMGGEVRIENAGRKHGEPVADLWAQAARLRGHIELSGPIIANLIDEIPILAVAGTRIDGSLTIRGAQELRVKESDRINAIVENLKRMGIVVEEFEDGFHLEGGQPLKGARLDSFGDHRIAMAFAVAGLLAEGETIINGAEAAAVSLPEFYELLAAAGADIQLED